MSINNPARTRSLFGQIYRTELALAAEIRRAIAAKKKQEPAVIPLIGWAVEKKP